MTLEEANKYADEMDKLNDEREEFAKKLIRVRCSDKHREFIEWLLTEETPCDTCEYEEGSIYCKEHCPHEAKIEKEPCEDAISRQYLLDNCVIDKVTMPYVPINKIQEAPPVNPTKTGRWILIDKELSRYKCSECGEVIKLYKKSEISKLEKDETLSDYPFSHCGAKMSES